MSKGLKVAGDAFGRRCLSPGEFEDVTARLRDLYPGLSVTSGPRSLARNEKVGGHPKSKHAIRRRIAEDYSLENKDGSSMDTDQKAKLGLDCLVLGLWFIIHDVGSGNHLHVQGLPAGEIPSVWWDRFGD